MRSKKFVLSLFLLLMTVMATWAQSPGPEILNLEQCLEYAYEHNESLHIADLEMDKQRAYVGEVTATGLPQVNGKASFTKNITVRQGLFDISGFSDTIPKPTYIVNRLGTEYEGDVGITASQLIFNGSYFVGLKAAKTYKELSSKEYIKTKIDVAEAVMKAYYSVLVAEEGLRITKNNFSRLDSLLKETKVMFENGFVERIDMNRTQVQFNNVEAQLQNQERLLSYSKQLLKFQMGYPLDAALDIADKPEDLKSIRFEEIEDEVNPKQRIEYEQLQVNQTLAQLDLRNNHVQYLPNLDINYGVGMSAGTPSSSELFSVGGDFWFNYQYIGLTASVPIFDGFLKSKRIQQNRIQLQQIDYQFRQLRRQISIEAANSRNNLLNNLNNLENQRENMTLAEEVYNVAKVKYQEGVGSSIELTEADNTFKEAQSNYYTALLETLLSKVEYEKALGVLIEK